MKTFDNLKDEIARIKALEVEGFDNDLVLRKFARQQALINIHLIKPYTDKYDLIVVSIVTGKHTYGAIAFTDAVDNATGDVDALAAAKAAYYSTYPAYSATYAASAAANAANATDYTKAIESLNTLSNEYLALLPKRKQMSKFKAEQSTKEVMQEAIQCIELSSSMVSGGEEHSDNSQAVKLQTMENLRKAIEDCEQAEKQEPVRRLSDGEIGRVAHEFINWNESVHADDLVPMINAIMDACNIPKEGKNE